MTLAEGQDQHVDAVAVQQQNALRVANEVREARKKLQVEMTAGRVTLQDVLLPDVNPIVRNMFAADVVRWTPRMSSRRFEGVTRKANMAAVNLLVLCPAMTRAERQWVVDVVRKGSATSLPRMLSAADRRVLALEKRVEVLTVKNDLLEQQMLNRQFSFTTGEANERLSALADAVEIHKRSVSDMSTPAEVWANADEILWDAKNVILEPLWFPGEQAA